MAGREAIRGALLRVMAVERDDGYWDEHGYNGQEQREGQDNDTDWQGYELEQYKRQFGEKSSAHRRNDGLQEGQQTHLGSSNLKNVIHETTVPRTQPRSVTLLVFWRCNTVPHGAGRIS